MVSLSSVGHSNKLLDQKGSRTPQSVASWSEVQVACGPQSSRLVSELRGALLETMPVRFMITLGS